MKINQDKKVLNPNKLNKLCTKVYRQSSLFSNLSWSETIISNMFVKQTSVNFH